MKYQLMMRAIPREDEAIGRFHERFMRQLARVKAPWGLAAKKWPEADEPDEFMSWVSLTRWMCKGVQGEVAYQNREWVFREDNVLRDQASSDDYFTLKFNPEKQDYRALVRSALPKYIEAFKPYVASVEDLEFVHKYFDQWQRSNDGRHEVFMLSPVCWFARELCKDAFGLTPAQVVKKLAGEVEEVRELSEGVLIMVSAEVLPFEEADRLVKRVDRLLPRVAKKGGKKRTAPKPKRDAKPKAAKPAKRSEPKMSCLNGIFEEFAGAFVGIVVEEGDIPSAGKLNRPLLDYSLESLKEVDRYLAAIRKGRRKFTDRELSNLMHWGGAYVGEVIRRTSGRKHNWVDYEDLIAREPEVANVVPLAAETRAVLYDGERAFWPMAKIMRFMEEGPEHSMHYYAACERGQA